MHEDELLDLVDGNDNVIGTILRNQHDDTIENPTQFIRAVEIFLVNSKGKLWVPKRTAHKQLFPNGLDYSCAGHVDSGESYEQAALREIHEELNLSLQVADLQLINKTRNDRIGYYIALYAYRTDITPAYNPDDFVSATWMSPHELLALLDTGVTAKTTIRGNVALLMQHGY